MTLPRNVLFTILLAMALTACGESGDFSPDEAATAIAETVAALDTPTGATTAEPAATAEEHTVPSATAAPTPSLVVVYTDGGNVALVGESGGPTFLTGSGRVEQVRISDDGTKIAYTRRPVDGAPVELHVVNADASGDTILMSPSDFDALYPLSGALHHDLYQFDFLPASRVLLLNTRSIFEGPGLAKLDDLIRIDTDSLSRTLLLAPGTGGDFTASPDGRYLALVRPDTIEIRMPDGSPSGSGVITYAPVVTYSEYAYYAQPVWRSDSTLLGSVIPSSDPLAPATSGAVWRLPPGAAAGLVSTISAQFFFFGTGTEPLLSPTLDRLAYTRSTTTPNVWNLYIASDVGSGEVLVASGDVTWKGWSPDGARFVFSLGGPMSLQLGDTTGASAPLVTGTSLRWFNPAEFLFLSGSSSAWTLQRGGVGLASAALASPAGSFVDYDFAYR